MLAALATLALWPVRELTRRAIARSSSARGATMCGSGSWFWSEEEAPQPLALGRATWLRGHAARREMETVNTTPAFTSSGCVRFAGAICRVGASRLASCSTTRVRAVLPFRTTRRPTTAPCPPAAHRGRKASRRPRVRARRAPSPGVGQGPERLRERLRAPLLRDKRHGGRVWRPRPAAAEPC